MVFETIVYTIPPSQHIKKSSRGDLNSPRVSSTTKLFALPIRKINGLGGHQTFA